MHWIILAIVVAVLLAAIVSSGALVRVVSTILIVGVLGVAGFAWMVWFVQPTPQTIAAAQTAKEEARKAAKQDYEKCLAEFGSAAHLMENQCRDKAFYYPVP
jgi:hypothetical protein